MLTEELKDKINEIISVSELHHQRLKFAQKKLELFFPLSLSEFEKLTPDQISLTDQLIYLFSKLQDAMGRKAFVLILKELGEDVENVPFIDLLNRLEKLGIIPDSDQWLELRETRNLVAHEYPYHRDEYIEGLNKLYSQSLDLSELWLQISKYAKNKFNL